jgi:excisionase family DNA binding protein
MSTEEWITAQEAAPILRVGVRQVHRYAEQGQLVTRRAGRRVLFDRTSIDALAQTLAVDVKPETAQTARQDIVQPSELLNYLRERDQQLENARRDLAQAMLEIGRLQARLQTAEAEVRRLQAPPPETPETLETAQTTEAATTETAEISVAERWWKRLFGS